MWCTYHTESPNLWKCPPPQFTIYHPSCNVGKWKQIKILWNWSKRTWAWIFAVSSGSFGVMDWITHPPPPQIHMLKSSANQEEKPSALRTEPILLTLWPQTSSLSKCEAIHIYCLNRPAHGILLWQPLQTNSVFLGKENLKWRSVLSNFCGSVFRISTCQGRIEGD